jgi:hypothetical protein
LPGHNKCSADVAVLDEPFAKLRAQLVGHRQGCRPTGVRDWNHHINIVIVLGKLAEDPPRQMFSHSQTTLIHRYVVYNGIRPRKIHMLENTGYEFRVRGTLVTKNFPLVRNEYRLTRSNVVYAGVAEYI